MEGVGSRLGRASSRYGPATAVSMFNGPVRKWKKRWVHVSSSPSTVSYQNHPHSSQSNGRHSATTTSAGGGSGGSRLLLCRWTPIPPATPDGGGPVCGSGGDTDESPKRKFRYTPIAVLEEQKKVAEKKLEDEARISGTEQYEAKPTTAATISEEMDEKPNINEFLMNEAEALERIGSEGSITDTSNLDLELGLKGQDNLLESLGRSKETPMNAANSTGFWSVG